MLRRIVVLVLLAAVLVGALVISQRRDEPLKVSGFVEADEIRVGSRVGGRIASVHVEEGQRVEAGTVLVELEPYDLVQRRAEAAAQVAQKRAELEELKSGYRSEEIEQARARRAQLAAQLEKLRSGPRKQEIAAAAAQVDLAQAEFDLAQQVYDRTANLFQRGTSTQEEMDQARTQLRVATARVRANTEQLEVLQEGTRAEDVQAAEAQLREAEEALRLLERGYRPEQITQAEAALAAAEASADIVERQLAELKIVAPVEAVVDAVELEPGDLVPGNAPAITLVDLSHLWVRAYVPENELDFQLGQMVEVTVDSYPEEVFQGRITFVARQAEFTPGNVQTPEERSKQVFRIRVALEPSEPQLRPGMAADVWLEPRETSR